MKNSKRTGKISNTKNKNGRTKKNIERERNKKIKSKRLSFKDAFLADRAKKVGTKAFVIIFRLFLCAVIFFTVLIVYQNRHDLSYNGFMLWVKDNAAKSGTGDGFPTAVSGKQAYNLREFNGTVVSLTDTSIIAYNSSGKRCADRSHSFKNPVVKLGYSHLLLYDMGNTKYRIESISGILFEGKTEESIITADIGQTGEYSIVTRENGYLAAVTMYNRNGNPQFMWRSLDYQIVDVAVSPDGNNFAVAGIRAQNGDIESSVMVFSRDSEQAIAKYTEKGNMYLSLEYTSPNLVTIIGDRNATAFKVTESSAFIHSYNGGSLACYDVEYGEGAAILISKYTDRKSCSMIVLDKFGAEVSNSETELDALSVRIKGRYVYILASGYFYEYKNTGIISKEIEVGGDISQAAILGSNAYVGGLSSIRKVNI